MQNISIGPHPSCYDEGPSREYSFKSEVNNLGSVGQHPVSRHITWTDCPRFAQHFKQRSSRPNYIVQHRGSAVRWYAVWCICVGCSCWPDCVDPRADQKEFLSHFQAYSAYRCKLRVRRQIEELLSDCNLSS